MERAISKKKIKKCFELSLPCQVSVVPFLAVAALYSSYQSVYFSSSAPRFELEDKPHRASLFLRR